MIENRTRRSAVCHRLAVSRHELGRAQKTGCYCLDADGVSRGFEGSIRELLRQGKDQINRTRVGLERNGPGSLK